MHDYVPDEDDLYRVGPSQIITQQDVAAYVETRQADPYQPWQRDPDWDDYVSVWSLAKYDPQILDESNFRRILADLTATAEREEEAEPLPGVCPPVYDYDDGHVYGTHFLLVQVHDGQGRFTDAIVEAAVIDRAMEQYGVYDESDYCELESERQMQDFNLACEDAAREYLDDDDEEDAIRAAILADKVTCQRLFYSEHYGTVSWFQVAEAYRAARDNLASLTAARI